MNKSRQHKPSIPRWGIEHLLFEMEEDGVLAWTGEYRNDQRVYVITDAGRYAYDEQESRYDDKNRSSTESHADRRRLRRDAVQEYLSKRGN